MRPSRGMGAIAPEKTPKSGVKRDGDEPVDLYAKGGWIKDAVKKPGALHEQLGMPKGEKIPAKKIAAAAEKGGKLGQRARLAQTFAKMRKK